MGTAVKRSYKTGNRNRRLTKLVIIVPYKCEITHANFGGDRTTFVKLMAKKLMHPSSRTQAWLPSVLILRGVWHGHLLRGETTPRCLACQVELTVEHILLHCVSFTNAHDHFFCVTLTSASELFSKVASRSIINFIKETGFNRKN